MCDKNCCDVGNILYDCDESDSICDIERKNLKKLKNYKAYNEMNIICEDTHINYKLASYCVII